MMRTKLLGLLAAGMLLGTGTAANATFIASYYEIDVVQVGSNVVATGSGTIDTNAMDYSKTSSQPAFIVPAAAVIGVGTTAPYDVYASSTVFPSSTFFGTYDNAEVSDSGTGPFVGFCGVVVECVDNVHVQFVVPKGYISGDTLSTSTATWDSTTLSALDLTPGIYTWTWPNGADESLTDQFVVKIGQTVPEPTSIALLGLGLAGLGISRRKSRQ